MKIHGFAVFRKKDGSGFFVAAPSRKAGERWLPIVEITDKATKEAIESAVIEAYHEAIAATPETPDTDF